MGTKEGTYPHLNTNPPLFYFLCFTLYCSNHNLLYIIYNFLIKYLMFNFFFFSKLRHMNYDIQWLMEHKLEYKKWDRWFVFPLFSLVLHARALGCLINFFFFFFFWERLSTWHPLLIIVIYHQTKTLIDFSIGKDWTSDLLFNHQKLYQLS